MSVPLLMIPMELEHTAEDSKDDDADQVEIELPRGALVYYE